MSFRDDLIAVFAAHTVAEIKAGGVARYEALCQQYSNEPQFRTERDQIERAKTKVQAALNISVPQREQVSKAIDQL